MKTWIGIDNGVSGSIGVLSEANAPQFIHAREYTRKNPKKKSALEVDPFALLILLQNLRPNGIVLERPYRGAYRTTEISAATFDGVVRTVMELYSLPFIQVDSREWQKPLLGTVPAGETKRASAAKGMLRWPSLKEQIEDHGDADGLWMAAYAMRLFP